MIEVWTCWEILVRQDKIRLLKAFYIVWQNCWESIDTNRISSSFHHFNWFLGSDRKWKLHSVKRWMILFKWWTQLKISAGKFNSQSTTSHDTEQAISPIGIFNRVAFCDSITASQRSLPEESEFFILWQDKKKSMFKKQSFL